MVEFNHKSVLLDECIKGLNIKKDGVYLDLTLGGAGHSSEILKRLENGLLIGIDRDDAALDFSLEKLKSVGSNFVLSKANFLNFDLILDELEIEKVDGVLIDLGVSSYQLDTADRGFSYRYNSRLDMRMDTSQKIDAQYVVNNYTEDKLKEIIKDYGEEKWATRIAKFIVEKRPIKTTFELVDVIKAAVPVGARDDKHPAKRTFQAIRIEVNKELEIISPTIDKIISRLNKNGRLAIITFHSLEDRLVKRHFDYLSKTCICPEELPICNCDKVKEVKKITKKPIVAKGEELEENNRSHSAKLRIVEKW